ncbi:unnamed protein product [Soboliphyme baturini]|uniref:Uncharacterized protein n=1 Tax=Soboliphyme baturini TaxID=241478 RepID=A0A3P8AV36_9BILA|nr:unnamed protein product [Soboliphyme baturini]
MQRIVAAAAAAASAVPTVTAWTAPGWPGSAPSTEGKQLRPRPAVPKRSCMQDMHQAMCRSLAIDRFIDGDDTLSEKRRKQYTVTSVHPSQSSSSSSSLMSSPPVSSPSSSSPPSDTAEIEQKLRDGVWEAETIYYTASNGVSHQQRLKKGTAYRSVETSEFVCFVSHDSTIYRIGGLKWHKIKKMMIALPT